MRLGGALLLAWTLVRLVIARVLRAAGRVQPRLQCAGRRHAGDRGRLLRPGACSTGATANRCPDRAGPEIAALYVLGNVLTIVLLTTEISFYWQMREDTDADGAPRPLSVGLGGLGRLRHGAHRRRHRAAVRANPLPGHRAAGGDDREGLPVRPVDARRHLPDHRLRRPRRVPAARRVAVSAVPGRHRREGTRRRARSEEPEPEARSERMHGETVATRLLASDNSSTGALLRVTPRARYPIAPSG